MLDALELSTPALAGDGVEVRLLELDRLGDLDMTAALTLTASEQAEYAELRHPLRRREWLGARVCLKLMAQRQGRVASMLDCAVLKDSRGRPRLVFAEQPAIGVVIDCSLSHKGRFVCAATSSVAGSRIGVDVEEISPRLRRLTRQFVHARDRLLPSHPEDEGLAILWALKEACSKVVGRGLAMAFGNVCCEETTPGVHRVMSGELELTGRHTTHEGYAVALCIGAIGTDAS